MTNWKRVGLVLLTASLALIASLIIWYFIAKEQYNNCMNNIESIRNNPEGLVAKECMRWGVIPD